MTPLRASTYLTLDEALVSRTARAGEVSDGGSLPELLFRNLGERPVLLVEGEELVGVKQNRAFNNDLRCWTLYGCTRCSARPELPAKWDSLSSIR